MLVLVLASAQTVPRIADAGDYGTLSGNLRFGIISAEDDVGESSDATAIGGKLGYRSPQWDGLSAGATLYTTQQLIANDNDDFFSSDGSGYSILGEAYVEARLGKVLARVGRFEFDSPHADTDDIRMVPNTFQGAMATYAGLLDTTFHFAFLDRWAGVDAPVPEQFRDLNDDDGVLAGGVSYEGVDGLGVQAWYYHGEGLAGLFYAEAVYEAEHFSVGAQFGSQDDKTADASGSDGDVYGVLGSVTYAGVTLSAAFNDVSGTVTNGFGGGPFFTSADDLTIDGIEDQRAIAVGAEYGRIENLSFGVLHVDFDKGADETDWYALYEPLDNLSFEVIYTDMHDDGHFVRLLVNYRFSI